MFSPANTAAQAAEMLLERHYAILRLPGNVKSAENRILTEGLAFFDLAANEKFRFASIELLEGYRKLGSEKDDRTGRPDLSESFTCWFSNVGKPSVEWWARDCAVHRAMRDGLTVYATITEQILAALRKLLASESNRDDGIHLNVRELSYLQINHTKPVEHLCKDRETLMDPHEDGHILTLLKPTASGLMICPGSLVDMPSKCNPAGRFAADGNLTTIEIGPEEILIVPSSPTFFLTGGRIKPLFHAVANNGQPVRQSLMFFANPSPTSNLSPWVENETYGAVDIFGVIDAVSGKYGLPNVSSVT